MLRAVDDHYTSFGRPVAWLQVPNAFVFTDAIRQRPPRPPPPGQDTPGGSTQPPAPETPAQGGGLGVSRGLSFPDLLEEMMTSGEEGEDGLDQFLSDTDEGMMRRGLIGRERMWGEGKRARRQVEGFQDGGSACGERIDMRKYIAGRPKGNYGKIEMYSCRDVN